VCLYTSFWFLASRFVSSRMTILCHSLRSSNIWAPYRAIPASIMSRGDTSFLDFSISSITCFWDCHASLLNSQNICYMLEIKDWNSRLSLGGNTYPSSAKNCSTCEKYSENCFLFNSFVLPPIYLYDFFPHRFDLMRLRLYLSFISSCISSFELPLSRSTSVSNAWYNLFWSRLRGGEYGCMLYSPSGNDSSISRSLYRDCHFLIKRIC